MDNVYENKMPSTRKAPSDSATLFKKGTVKKGNDGNKWMIVADNRGIQRWQKITQNKTVKRKNKSKRVTLMKAVTDTVWGKTNLLNIFGKSWHQGVR